MKILIVDDVAFMLVSLRQLLQRNGHQVITASGAKEALEHLANDFTIDAVITDLIMPDITGFELYEMAVTIERFNDDGVIPAPPFLLLTSFDDSNPSSTIHGQFEEAQRCFAAVLHKPVEEAELLPVLHDIQKQKTGLGQFTVELQRLLQQSTGQIERICNPGDAVAIISQLQEQLVTLSARLVS